MKLNDLDLNKLHVFRVVAESASMRQAGERLLRTASAISQSITGLERGLGLQLFVRTGNRLELTEAGRKILRQVKASEQGLLELLDEVRGTQALVRGLVTLGLPPGYPAVSLGEGLSAALVSHVELQLRLRFLPHAGLSEALSTGQLDMALSIQPLRQWNRKLRSTALREENLILVVPPRFRNLGAGPVGELPVVDYYQKPLLIEGWLKHHRQNRATPRIRVYASNLDHVLQLVSAGVGCAVVPRHVVATQLAEGRLLEHGLDKRRPWIVRVWLNAAAGPDRFTPAASCVWQALNR